MAVIVHILVISESTTVAKYMKSSNGGGDVHKSKNYDNERRTAPQELVDEEVKMKAIVLQGLLHLKEEESYMCLVIYTISTKEEILKKAE